VFQGVSVSMLAAGAEHTMADGEWQALWVG